MVVWKTSGIGRFAQHLSELTIGSLSPICETLCLVPHLIPRLVHHFSCI